MKDQKVSIFWYRRDLRLDDNVGLHYALRSKHPVVPIFIFDQNILENIPVSDARISFIHEQLTALQAQLQPYKSSIFCTKGDPIQIWKEILQKFNVQEVYTNEDYEPYAINRDQAVQQLLQSKHIPLNSFKDQVIFAKSEIVKKDQSPYTVFTPYKNKWMDAIRSDRSVLDEKKLQFKNFQQFESDIPTLSSLGFTKSALKVINFDIDHLENYSQVRDYPGLNQTSSLSPHLRFGTVSIRSIVKKVFNNEVFLSELIWREFFMQILFHFPTAVNSNFRKKYDLIAWRNNVGEFEKWKTGHTGYPIVDAGMRELNATGYMHNRVRMVVAGFLCKHLLIDWRWGEAYFAEKLLDYDLSANNGNWQWAAGTGCDAAPYFRVFNPTEQVRKFDKKLEYINKWVPELNSLEYPAPIVEHKFARERAIATYKKGIQQYTGI